MLSRPPSAAPGDTNRVPGAERPMTDRSSGRVPPIPFAGSYWVLPGSFLAGIHPGDRHHATMHARIVSLLATGIRHIVGLAGEGELDRDGRPRESYLLEWKSCAIERSIFVSAVSFPIDAHHVPSPSTMKIILDNIDRAIAQGLPVYLHDSEGRGRTGTVVACFLARHGLAAGNDLFETIAALRAAMPDAQLPSPESDEQRRFAAAWRRGE